MSTIPNEPVGEPDDEADEEVDQEALPFDDTDERPGLEKTRPSSISEAHLKSVLESLVFVSDKPVAAKRLARIARAKVKDVERILGELAAEYGGRGIELIEVGGGWQFRSAVANAPFVREIVARRPVRLTRAQLETLAIASYRQPLTRPELDEIRGVDSGSALKVLLERGLVKILGRKDEAGRPLLYGTTPYFLEFFGLSSLEQLPTLKEFTELSPESRALFARKIGEEIDTIGDIDVPERSWSDEEAESEAEARGEGHGADGETVPSVEAPIEPDAMESEGAQPLVEDQDGETRADDDESEGADDDASEGADDDASEDADDDEDDIEPDEVDDSVPIEDDDEEDRRASDDELDEDE